MTEHVLVATLGAEAQVITLSLDALLAQGMPITQVIVIHTDPTREPIRSALLRLRQEFLSDGPYDRQIIFAPHVLTAERGPLIDVVTSSQIDAAFHAIYLLLRYHRQAGHRIHLAISGGRKTLTIAAMMAAHATLSSDDYLWYTLSTEALYASRTMHADDPGQVTMVHMPILADQTQEKRANTFLENLPRAERELLLLLLREGLSNAALAERLGKSPRTIANQLTSIYRRAGEAFGMAKPLGRAELMALLGRYS
jgi:CRISPR-associated protein Csx14